jgi:hypothetical protein
MSELTQFLIKWLQKNKTLFFFIFSLSLFLSSVHEFKNCFWSFKFPIPPYKAVDNLFFYLLKIFLLSFGITRVLVYLNVVKIILSIPILSDIIFAFGREERYLIKSFNEFTKEKPEEYEYLKSIYEIPVIRIAANEINDDNLKVISLLKDIEHYNFLEDYKITNQFQNLTLNKDILTTLKSTIQPTIKDLNDYITKANNNASEKIKNLETKINTIQANIKASYNEASKTYELFNEARSIGAYYYSSYYSGDRQRLAEIESEIREIKFNSQENELSELITSLKEDFYKDLANKFVQLATPLKANVLNDDILISFSLKPVIIRQLKKNASKKTSNQKKHFTEIK